jgi:hypothetical protein
MHVKPAASSTEPPRAWVPNASYELNALHRLNALQRDRATCRFAALE